MELTGQAGESDPTMTPENMPHPPLPYGNYNDFLSGSKNSNLWQIVTLETIDRFSTLAFVRKDLPEHEWSVAEGTIEFNRWLVFIQPLPNWRELMAADQAGDQIVEVNKRPPVFEDYWVNDGVGFDPDPNISWGDKREELARHAFIAGMARGGELIETVNKVEPKYSAEERALLDAHVFGKAKDWLKREFDLKGVQDNAKARYDEALAMLAARREVMGSP